MSLIHMQRLEEQEQNNEQILQLADDMASIITYIEDVEQFARIVQLKKAMEDIRPLIEDTTNFILRYTSRTGTGTPHSLVFQCITNNSFRSHF
jgi:C4-dicarboxylate-specific signal transduction histidine kinase